MTLRGNYGGELTAIGCDVFKTDVVILDDDGNQVQGHVGRAIQVKPGFIDHAPEGCPLTLEPKTRELGSFVVCKSCPHATLESSGLIEC